MEFVQFDIAVGYLGGEVKKQQTYDYSIYRSQPQVSSRPLLKLTGLEVNIHKGIDATKISEFVK